MVHFQQPWGFLALLSLLALLFLYRFVRAPVQQWITVAFLLPVRSRRQPQGRTWHRLRLPPSFWAASLALLALAVALAQPHWRQSQQSPTIHLLLDGSFSMSAFRPEILSTIRRLLNFSPREVQWVVIDSAQPHTPLVRTSQAGLLLARLERWLPSRGAHDLGEVLARCRAVAPTSPQTWIVLSDQPRAETAIDAHWITVGRPLPNAGFAGSLCENEAEGWHWRAYVRNYSQQPLSREFSLKALDRVETRSLLLPPGQILPLEGRLPADCPQAVLELTPDEFFLDDTLPLAPSPDCPIAVNLPMAQTGAWTRLLQSIPQTRAAERDTAQFAVEELPAATSVSWLAETPLAGAVLFFQASGETATWTDNPVPSAHPWMHRLNWSGLLAQPSGELAAWLASEAPAAEVLLYTSQHKPLVAAATRAGTKLLLFDFSTARSNAFSLPAFVLLLNRFIQEVRQGLPCPRLVPLSVGQAWPVGAPPVRFQPAHPETARQFGPQGNRPLLPGFFLPYSAGAEAALQTPLGVVQFTDLAEADLQQCPSVPPPPLEEVLRPANLSTTRESNQSTPWILAAMILQTLAWYLLGKEEA